MSIIVIITSKIFNRIFGASSKIKKKLGLVLLVLLTKKSFSLFLSKILPIIMLDNMIDKITLPTSKVLNPTNLPDMIIKRGDIIPENKISWEASL